MATTSTVPTVIDRALVVLTAAGLAAFESWPGPTAAPEMVVLGAVTWEDYEIASIKAGRKQRQENYGIGFEVFVIGAAGTTPADPSAARDRAFTLLAEVEDAFADDPKIGLATGVVQRIETRLTEAGPRVFEKGWAYRCAGRLDVHARLT